MGSYIYQEYIPKWRLWRSWQDRPPLRAKGIDTDKRIEPYSEYVEYKVYGMSVTGECYYSYQFNEWRDRKSNRRVVGKFNWRFICNSDWVAWINL